MKRSFSLLAGVLIIALGLSGSAWGEQYRSKILIDHADTLETGTTLSLEQLEQQLADLTEPYARASTSRHLARGYIQQEQYDKAIEYYLGALKAEGLSDIADREMLRELARVYLLKKDYALAAGVLERVLLYALVHEKSDYLLLAQSWLLSGDSLATVKTLDRLKETDILLEEDDMRRVLALYYQSGAYSQCATVLQELLRRSPENPDYWHQLTAMYLLMEQHRMALDHLSLAFEKRVPFAEDNLLLLVDLLAFNNQPFVAARLLRSEIEQGTITANGDHYRKLFELWLQAREKKQAIVALTQAANLTDDTELYLHLAQLQSEQENWQQMQATLLGACARELEDRYVSRANLLLGISQLKLGDPESARRSFINATLIGGAIEQAANWLNYMDAEPPTDAEIRNIVSPCYGSSDKRRRLVATQIPAQQPEPPVSIVDPKPVEPESVAIRTVPGLQLFTAGYEMDALELAEKFEQLVTRLAISLVRAGGEVSGPLHILFESGESVSGRTRETRLAFPTRGRPRPGGRYRVIRTEPFRCAYMTYEGAVDGIATAWAELARITEVVGHELNGQARFVFTCGSDCTSEHMVIEMQLGIE